MKLFENKVGRPTNEVIKKRRIFVGSVSAALLFIIVLTVFLVNSSKPNKLGASVAASVGNNKSYCDFYYQIVSNKEIKVLADCKGDAYPDIVRIYEKLSLKDTYTNQNKKAVSHWEYPFKLNIKSSKNYKIRFRVAHEESNKVESGSTNIKINSFSKKKKNITLVCPSDALVNEEFICVANTSGVSIVASTDGLDKAYNKSIMTRKDNLEIKLKYKTTGTKIIKAARGSKVVTQKVVIK